MKSALVAMTLLILPSDAGALTGAERGLTGGFASTTAVAKHENVCLPVITEEARKYLRLNPERLHRNVGILAILAIVQSFRCP